MMDRPDDSNSASAADRPVESLALNPLPEWPSLSIVVTWAGDEERLRGWVDEVLRITGDWDVEIIAVASPEETESVTFAAAYRGLRLISAPRGESLPVLRRMGMEAATGYLVLFSDAREDRSLDRLRYLITQLFAMQR